MEGGRPVEGVRPGIAEAVVELRHRRLDVLGEVRRRLLDREGLVGRGEAALRPAA